MQKFLKRCFLFLLPIVLLMMMVNYFGDAANLFSDIYEKNVAMALVEGKNVTNVLNCDERLLQKEIIRNVRFCPDVLVIGSSRIMEIRSEYFSSKSFLNNGVSGASIEDILAMLALYNQKGCLPGNIILGLDPWTLNKRNEQVRWLSLRSEYNTFLDTIGLSRLSVQTGSTLQRVKEIAKRAVKWYQLVSPSYFKSSLASLLLQDKTIHVTAGRVNNTFTRLADGSVTYDPKYRNPDNTERNKRVADFTATGIYSIENFDRLDSNIQQILEELISFLIKRGVTVSFFLSPYHPAVYEKIVQTEKYKMVEEAESYYISLARQNNIHLYGSFNPHKLKLTSDSFYDGMHCDDISIRCILEN